MIDVKKLIEQLKYFDTISEDKLAEIILASPSEMKTREEIVKKISVLRGEIKLMGEKGQLLNLILQGPFLSGKVFALQWVLGQEEKLS